MAMAGVGEALASVVLKEVSRKLGSAIGEQIRAQWNLERDMEDIKSTLGIVQAVLRDAEKRSVREEAVNLWLKMLKDAAYDISDMFDEFEVKLSKGKISSSVAKLTMGKKLKNMREKLTKIAARQTQFAFKLDTCSTDDEEIKKRQTTSKINRATIVGRQKEKDEIVTLLKSDEEQETLVIPIFGFAGIGKTTLARLVFNDDRMQDFDLRVWVYVSPHFDLEMIGKNIISQIKQHVDGLNGLQSISNCLEETLGGRSCLIILDDVWESNCFQLDNLNLMLSNFKEKSKIRIIVTTRTEEVARNIGNVTPYKLKPLSDDDCWTLFQHIAFQSGFSFRDDKNVMDKIGWDITKKCQGVPMAVQALGFMLRNKNVEEWKNVRDSDVWDGSSTTDMLPSLKLSYYQMADYLKLCFSYCSVFPKGCEIHRDNLIQQWISLGFIPSSPGEHLTLEKIGENYVNELLGMSFLQYSRLTSSITREETTNSMLLSMHHLIHDLARSVLGDELLFVDGRKGYGSKSGNHRYALVVNGTREIDFCNYVPTKLRSLHIFDSGEIHPSLYSKSLRVLDLSKFSSGNFPGSIGKLKQLRYLRVRGMQHKSVPKHVTGLSKLMYLDISDSSKISMLPKSVNKLRCLLHLDLSGCCNLCSLPESFCDLTNLTNLYLANCVLLSTLPDSVYKLRNLFRLDLSGCCNLCSLPETSGDLVNLSHLYLANCSLLKTLPESVEKLKSLLHLDLSGCSSLCSLPESFGEMINLSHLNLAKCTDLCSLPKSFGRLCALQYLNLSDCLRLDLWFDIETVCCLTKLQCLNLSRCPRLMHIPESINNLKDLHTLDLSRCHWIERFPESLCGMTSLKFLLIHECTPWFQQRVRVSQFKNDMLTLPKFIVQRTASGQSSNISRLQSVHPAELEIECLENVTCIEEANAVNLADKSELAKLVLAWTPEVERFVEDEALVRELQPPENLMFLKVQGYMATSFSGWVMGMESCLVHLVCIEMVDLQRCEHLPPFGQLQNLQQLFLKRMPILKKLGTEICGGSGAFKKLKEFTLENLDMLEEWVTKVPGNGEFVFPSLHKLEICQCPKLRLTPCLPRAFEWRIQASDEIIASQYDAGSTSSWTVSKLHVTSCQLQPDQWALLGFLPALEVLEISNYGEKKLPDSICWLVSLRSLKIDVSTEDPEKQSSLFFFLISTIFGDLEFAFILNPQLTALENLEIWFSDKLQAWCSKKHGRWTLKNINNKLAEFFERMVTTIIKRTRYQHLSSYILMVKQLADAFAGVGQTLRDKEIICHILQPNSSSIKFEDKEIIMHILRSSRWNVGADDSGNIPRLIPYWVDDGVLRRWINNFRDYAPDITLNDLYTCLVDIGVPSTSSGTSIGYDQHGLYRSSGSRPLRTAADAYPEEEQRWILETPDPRIFTFAELRAATRNFKPDMVLGEGGFGRVYKGWVDENTMNPTRSGIGMVVAVKKHKPESAQGLQELQSEVNFLGRLSHPNLVRLLGYCMEDRELLLVYEYMPNGSLANLLFRRRGASLEPIPWNLRLRIAIGAARGLAFLHSSEVQVIHRDVNASHILLDMNYNAKLSNFGLTMNGPTDGDSHVTTVVMGTNGYAAPEYVATGHLYMKSDVYGFGVVLLEMLTGRRALDTGRPVHNLVEWAKPYLAMAMADRRMLKFLVDSRLEGQYPSKAVLQATQLTLRCLERDPRSRPSMAEVVVALEEIAAQGAEVVHEHGQSSRSRSGQGRAGRSSHHR